MRVTRIKTNKFKSNEIAVFLAVPLKRETITKNALLPAVLKRGSQTYKNQLVIGKELENMYGASFNAGVEKTGSYSILKFYIESLSDDFITENENISEKSIKLLFDIIFNPYIKNDAFDEEYVTQEKKKLEEVIKSRADDKKTYAVNRCIEEMFKNDPYGLYKFGYIEDLKEITAKSLYDYYLQMLKECKVYIVINGKEADKIMIPAINSKLKNIKELNEIIYTDEKEKTNKEEKSKSITCEKLNKNDANFKSDNSHDISTNIKTSEEEKIVKEELDVTQGKLMIGLNVLSDDKFATSMYNVILGGSANSKLFQNVREKAGLAYFASSSYIRRKNAILIKTGIELKNYEKAVNIIKAQLEDIKNGNITDDEIKSGKQLIISSLKMIKESQEETIAFNFDQDLFDENLSIEEYIEKLENVTKERIIEVAKSVKVNTIYYLKNKE